MVSPRKSGKNGKSAPNVVSPSTTTPTTTTTYPDPGTVFDVPQNATGPAARRWPTTIIQPRALREANDHNRGGTQSLIKIERHDVQHNADRVGDQATSELQQPGQNRWNRKLLKNYCAITTNGCSRTTPVIWESEKEGDPRKQPVTSSPIKQELCVAVAPESTVSSSVSGSSTTGMNFVNIKIEPKSPNCNLAQNRDGGYSAISTMEASNSMATSSHHIATSQIPVGIAVARQRLHPDPGLTTTAGSAPGTMKDMHGSRHIGSTFVEMMQPLGNNIFLSAPQQSAPAMIGSWQYPMEPMQMPLPPVGLQLVREPTTGQYIFVPAMDPYPQAVVWPYSNVQPTQPAPIQFLGASDYLSASTTLHQHTSTSTRLVTLPGNEMKQRYMGGNGSAAGLQSAATSSDSSSALMGLVNKVSSLNSHLLPSTLNNTIIKIEDNCAISAGGGVSAGNHLMSQDQLPIFSSAPSDLMQSSGFLMPHTPMLTPAPNMFDMGEKPFLANIAQQQRQFQFHLNSSVKSEACSMSSDAQLTQAPDFSSLMYHPGAPSDYQHEMAAVAMNNQTSLDTSSMGLSGSHPTILLTPPTVLAARSTGGLLTPPSPFPQKAEVPQHAEMSDVTTQLTNSADGAVENYMFTADPAGGSVAITESSSQNHPISDNSHDKVGSVQDATMQTDTPVCSDEENTQDNVPSESGGVRCSAALQLANKESDPDQVKEEEEHLATSVQVMTDNEACHSNDKSTEVSSELLQREHHQSPDPDSMRPIAVDLSGLELLSNSIEAFETIKREACPTGKAGNDDDNQKVEPMPQQPPRHHSEQFDGLNLLCALAEQRLVEVEEAGEGELQQTTVVVAKKEHSVAQLMEVTPKKSTAVESDFDNSPVEKLSDLERNIKQRLADLTRQCEEKRRELDKMEKINPFYRMGYAQSYPVPNKFAMSDDEETRSSRSASVRTPLTPTLLFGTNSNGQGGGTGGFVAAHSEVAKVSSDTESSRYDDGDMSSLEKLSKRKGVLPKRWDDCSETETIVAKKPKGLASYIFSSKNRNENENRAVVGGVSSPLIKHGQLRPHYNPSPSSGSTSSEQPIKLEPIKIKEETVDDDGAMAVPDLFRATSVVGVRPTEERKHKKKNKAKKRHHREVEGKRRKSEGFNRCKLTDTHLDDKERKTRVLTSMGGLFYAGVLSPIQPPDIYSVVLDGERGNRPHIMSREEVQRDAVLEIIPTEPAEVPPGTRLCAYWSQQYRCLYPGTAAQPGTPDLNSKKLYISVEFDDGDSGRIAIGDIRLLFNDYPIVEYDPNPLLSLGKRKGGGRVGGAGTLPETGFNALFEPPQSSTLADQTDKLDRAAEKERRRIKKMKKHLLKKQQQLMACCQSTAAVAYEDGSRKKGKCMEDLCKHRRHKKKRKHKRHSQDREAPEEEKAVPSIAESSQESVVMVADNKQQFKVMDNEDTEETMDSCSAGDDPDFRDPSNKRKEHSPEQNKSKIAAFLPARQLWAWAGESYRRSCVKGRVKKQFYKMIQRGKEAIEVGDSAVFLSTGRPDRPYIGRITSMWKTNACNMIVRVKWFYHPEETEGCPSLKYPGGLFESPHEDENDVQTISHKCEVLSVYDFIRKLGDDPKNLSLIYDNNDTYYLAGNYDPTALQLNMQPDIPTMAN